MKNHEDAPPPRGDSILLQRGYTPKASLSPDKIVPPKGGTGETTLATRPPSADNPPSPPPKKD